MNNNKIFTLNGRVVYPFPWESKSLPCPWKQATHMRVMIPYNQQELKKAKNGKRAHVQIVRSYRVQTYRTGLPMLQSRNSSAQLSVA